jgi:predicted membrane-bound spermidine synthase
VLAAAFMSGFTFFVAELVWYRISTPLLGGSVYGFGLVLCVVLTGMGIGGLLYSLILKKAEPSIAGLHHCLCPAGSGGAAAVCARRSHRTSRAHPE